MRARGRLTPLRRRRNADDKGKQFEYAEAPPAPELHASPEQCLFIAVIERAFLDVQGSDKFEADLARRWLLEEPAFLLVADYAGVEDPQAFREIVARWLANPVQATGYGPIVRDLLERAGATQREFGVAVGIGQGTVSATLCGWRSTSRELIERTVGFFRERGLDTSALEALLGPPPAPVVALPVRRRETILTGPVEWPLAA